MGVGLGLNLVAVDFSGELREPLAKHIRTMICRVIFSLRECRSHMSRHTIEIGSLRAAHKLWQVEKHRRNLQGSEGLGQVKKHRRWTCWFQSPLMAHLASKDFFEQMLLLLSGLRVLLTADTWLRSTGVSLEHIIENISVGSERASGTCFSEQRIAVIDERC